jgi:hypothetical protein
VAEIPVNAPQLGAQGETCAQCGAPLVPDQRYCLSCGTRRADARLPFRDALAPPAGGRAAFDVVLAGAAPPPPGAPAPPAAVDRARANLALVAGLGCLLLALGVGILIGRSGNDPVRQSAPQVISVGSGAPAATTPSGADAGGAGGAGAGAGAANGSGAAHKAKKKQSSKAAGSAAQSKATSKALQDLQNASPQDYQKQSQKLPSKVGTGGAPPPVDKSKPAGAGTSVQEIG